MGEVKRILIVEDEGIVAQHVTDLLTRRGFKVIGTAIRGEDAVGIALSERPDLIMMDIRLKGRMDGIEAVELIHKEAYVPVLYMTAYTEMATMERANRTRHSGFLQKPVRDEDLAITVSAVLSKVGHGPSGPVVM